VVRGRVVGVVVDAEDHGQILVLGRRGDYDFGRSMVEVAARPAGVGEDAGGLDHDLDAVVAPRNLPGVALGDHGDALAVDHEVAVDDIDFARVAAVVGVVLEQVRATSTSAMSLMATTERLSRCPCSMARKLRRPMRPKPLMATLVVMAAPASS